MAKEVLVADSGQAAPGEFKKVFEDTDYRVIFSKSGEDVALRAKLIKPDLVILAQDLGPKTGLDVCKAIKTDPELKEIPVLLLENVSGEISDLDRQKVQADGVLSRPLEPDGVVNLAERLVEVRRRRSRGEAPEDDSEWEGFTDAGQTAPGKRGVMAFEEGSDEEDEIIELVDVVEEPEAKMSITDLAVSEKVESLAEIAPLGGWEKEGEEVKIEEKDLFLVPEDKRVEPKETPGVPPGEAPEKPVSPEQELFDKIELKDILQQVEQLRPSLEVEFPSEKEAPKPPAVLPETEALQAAQVSAKAEMPAEKILGLEGFETPLKVKEEVGREEEAFESLTLEESKLEIPEESVPLEIAEEEGDLEALIKEALPQEGEPEEVAEEEPPEEVVEEEPPEEVELTELPEEEFPEALLEEIPIEEESAELDEGEPLFERESLPEVELAGELETGPEEAPAAVEEEMGGIETLEEFPREELGVIPEMRPEAKPELPLEMRSEARPKLPLEMRPERKTEEKPPVPFEEWMEEAISTGAEEEASEERFLDLEEFEEALKKTTEEKPLERELRPPAVEEPTAGPPEAFSVSAAAVESQIQEVIQKRVQEMMADFTNKIVPEMTHQIVRLTMERIEMAVRDMVPELAERVIQEELRRLGKGEKE